MAKIDDRGISNDSGNQTFQVVEARMSRRGCDKRDGFVAVCFATNLNSIDQFAS